MKTLLKEIGWKDEATIDLGDITASRGTKSLVLLWLRIWGTTIGTFSLKVVN
jgi:hypothetical protein